MRMIHLDKPNGKEDEKYRHDDGHYGKIGARHAVVAKLIIPQTPAVDAFHCHVGGNTGGAAGSIAAIGVPRAHYLVRGFVVGVEAHFPFAVLALDAHAPTVADVALAAPGASRRERAPFTVRLLLRRYELVVGSNSALPRFGRLVFAWYEAGAKCAEWTRFWNRERGWAI